MREVMITTQDNPYNPFDEFSEWWHYDVMHHYNTSMRLASIVTTSEAFSDEENMSNIEKGIDELIKYGAINTKGEKIAYVKIIRDATEDDGEPGEGSEN